MDSRVFIRQATTVSTKLHLVSTQAATLSTEDLARRRGEVQRDLTVLFGGLQNPSLPSALKLMTDAVAAGYQVPPRTVAAIQDADKNAWSY